MYLNEKKNHVNYRYGCQLLFVIWRTTKSEMHIFICQINTQSIVHVLIRRTQNILAIFEGKNKIIFETYVTHIQLPMRIGREWPSSHNIEILFIFLSLKTK